MTVSTQVQIGPSSQGAQQVGAPHLVRNDGTLRGEAGELERAIADLTNALNGLAVELTPLLGNPAPDDMALAGKPSDPEADPRSEVADGIRSLRNQVRTQCRTVSDLRSRLAL